MLKKGLFVILASMSFAAAGHGITYDWINTSGGTFSSPGNWAPAGPPGSADFAKFNLNNSYTVSFSANAPVKTCKVAMSAALLDQIVHAPNNTCTPITPSHASVRRLAR